MQTVKVWDLPVRLCHWGLAGCVLANLAFVEEGSDIHEYIGYTAAGIVAFRLLWGFVGSRYARFGSFFPTPSRLMAHGRNILDRRPDTHLGHNPFGALMMLALWAVIIGLGVSGYLMGTDRFWGDETVEGIHVFLADSLIPLIALHVTAAIAMSFLGKSNLIAAMITGNKKVADAPLEPHSGQDRN